jgi:hypothetical protein
MECNHEPINDCLVFAEKGRSFMSFHESELKTHSPSLTAVGNILPPFLLLEDLVKCRTQGV